MSYATLQAAARDAAATDAQLTVLETHRRVGEIAVIRGAGSTALRASALRELFTRATESEQEFLVRSACRRAAPRCARGGDGGRDSRSRRALPVASVRAAAMYAPRSW